MLWRPAALLLSAAHARLRQCPVRSGRALFAPDRPQRYYILLYYTVILLVLLRSTTILCSYTRPRQCPVRPGRALLAPDRVRGAYYATILLDDTTNYPLTILTQATALRLTLTPTLTRPLTSIPAQATAHRSSSTCASWAPRAPTSLTAFAPSRARFFYIARTACTIV